MEMFQFLGQWLPPEIENWLFKKRFPFDYRYCPHGDIGVVAFGENRIVVDAIVESCVTTIDINIGNNELHVYNNVDEIRPQNFKNVYILPRWNESRSIHYPSYKQNSVLLKLKNMDIFSEKEWEFLWWKERSVMLSNNKINLSIWIGYDGVIKIFHKNSEVVQFNDFYSKSEEIFKLAIQSCMSDLPQPAN